MHLRYSFQSVSGAISDLNRDILLKPGFIPRARQAAVVSKNALLYSAGVKREKVRYFEQFYRDYIPFSLTTVIYGIPGTIFAVSILN